MPHEFNVAHSYDASFQRRVVADDPDAGYGKDLGKEFFLDVELQVHPHHNGIIVVSYPSIGADLHGYENKYEKLANRIQQHVGAVLRTDNPLYYGFLYDQSVQDHLRSVIDYALENAEAISAKPADETEIYLLGYSAGASGVAAVAHEYPQVTKMLLLAPSGDAGREAVTNGLGKYTGECHIVIGSDDELVGVHAGDIFASLATSASLVRKAVIPDCGHQFRGETNGLIMSASPLWAFSDAGRKQAAPRAEDGIVLYT